MMEKPVAPKKPNKPVKPIDYVHHELIPAALEDGTTGFYTFADTPWPNWSGDKDHLFDEECGDYIHWETWDGCAQPENMYDAIKAFADKVDVNPQSVKLRTYYKWERDDEPNIYFEVSKPLSEEEIARINAKYEADLIQYKKDYQQHKVNYAEYKKARSIWKAEQDIIKAQERLKSLKS
jgi:hypothetical protein